MKNTTKPKTIDYFRVARVVWRLFKKWLPKARKGRRGRPPADNRSILNGIW